MGRKKTMGEESSCLGGNAGSERLVGPLPAARAAGRREAGPQGQGRWAPGGGEACGALLCKEG